MHHRISPHHWVNTQAGYLHDFALTCINNEGQAKDLVPGAFLGALVKGCNFEAKSAERTRLTAVKAFKGVVQIYIYKLQALWVSVFTMKHIDNEPTDIIGMELKLTAANFWVIIRPAKLNLCPCL